MSNFNREAIKDVKKSIVAIGLVDSKLKIKNILGTGIVVDKKGIILSANHVFKDCKTTKEWYSIKEKISTDLAVFRPIYENNEFYFDKALIETEIQEVIYPGENSTPLFDLDLGYAKMKKPFEDISVLPINPPEKLEPLNAIGMCGFPAGEHTLDVSGEHIGLRYSPTVQLGRIGSLLPFDDAEKPYGIQTDIIGVGGSSGSPLIDPATGYVIGLAQKVLPADVTVYTKNFSENKTYKGFGSATIGQVYGISNHILYPCTNAMRKHCQTGKIEDFKISVTGLDWGTSVL